MSEWISVKDRLPQPFVDVLVYCVTIKGQTFQVGEKYFAIDRLGEWNHECETCFRTEDMFNGKVTHWMKLPEAPKE